MAQNPKLSEFSGEAGFDRRDLGEKLSEAKVLSLLHRTDPMEPADGADLPVQSA